MQEEAHMMNAYELKTKIDFDEFSMMNPFSNPLDDFGSYSSDPYMYSSHTIPDMNQPISSIAIYLLKMDVKVLGYSWVYLTCGLIEMSRHNYLLCL